jgi:dienelactone hydrolase
MTDDDGTLVTIPTDGVMLEGNLHLPVSAKGLVVFVHGSGSSRHSPRNRHVARALREGGLGTLLIDLLTIEEERYDERTAELRFDIDLLTRRVVGVTDWLATQFSRRDPRVAQAQSPPERGSSWGGARDLSLGLFGSSTGAAAALVAAAARPRYVGAVVSRGGRPDLAHDALPKVRAPTLLIVGGMDPAVVRLNQEAFAVLACEKRLDVVPGATHLFEEPGALDEVARLAREWFERHLGASDVHAVPGAFRPVP